MTLTVGARVGPYEVLSPLGLTASHAARFAAEARAIAALNHPHTCQIHDVGPDYLVLEYIEGVPLSGLLAVDRALTLAIQIAGALEEAHARNILHRDLKPANVMVTNRGVAKLLDFGLAEVVSDDVAVTRTEDGAIVGTVAYMSPKQAEGRTLDARSDVFGFAGGRRGSRQRDREVCGTRGRRPGGGREASSQRSCGIHARQHRDERARVEPLLCPREPAARHNPRPVADIAATIAGAAPTTRMAGARRPIRGRPQFMSP